MPSKFLKIGWLKILVMFFLTGSFYTFYWFYKQWKQLKLADEAYAKISPLARALFFPFYVFAFCRAVRAGIMAANPHDKKMQKKAAGLKMTSFLLFISAMLILIAAVTGLGNPWFIYVMLAVIMISIQDAINAASGPAAVKEKPLQTGDVVFTIIVFVIIALIAFAYTASKSAKGKACFAGAGSLSGSLYKNDCLGFSLNLPQLNSGRLNLGNIGHGVLFFKEDVSGREQLFNISAFRPPVRSIDISLDQRRIARDVLKMDKAGAQHLKSVDLRNISGKTIACLNFENYEYDTICYFNNKGLLVEIWRPRTAEHIAPGFFERALHGLRFN
ncbi:MAG: hypothetical protein LBR90_03500 [Elusimicrobiota bacterium]|jgi:hypothetical protein|nr:hypothetical protein [Elusimicrobiota bacterium]